jgi:hypothetical protein
LLGKDFQQQELILRGCIDGTKYQATLNGASVTQRKRPPPPSAWYINLPTAAGLAKAPFDVGMFGLGGWNANEPTVDGSVTGLHLTRRKVANCGRGQLEDPSGVAITKVDARERSQMSWRNLSGWPALSLRAERFAIHLEVAALTYSRPSHLVSCPGALRTAR